MPALLDPKGSRLPKLVGCYGASGLVTTPFPFCRLFTIKDNHNGLSYKCHIALGVAGGLQINLVKRKVVFLLVIEHILAPYGSEACRRENIYFIVFFPYKKV